MRNAALHAHRNAPNPQRIEFDALGTGTHMGILGWTEVWLIANALLLVWRILVTSQEMETRIGSFDFSGWAKETVLGARVEFANVSAPCGAPSRLRTPENVGRSRTGTGSTVA